MARYVVRMDKKARVFLLEDDPQRVEWFKKRIPGLVHVETLETAIEVLKDRVFDFVFLDHDLGLLDANGRDTGSGYDVAKYLSGRNWIGDNVVIHSWNPVGAARMKDVLEGACAIPFGQFEIDFV